MKCLIVECHNVAKTRGLCISCYQTARNKVLSKQTTWDALVAMVLALPAKHGGRSGGKFSDAFNKRNSDLPGQMKLFADKETT